MVEVEVALHDAEKHTLSIQVFAELEGDEIIGYSTFGDENVLSIIQ